MLNKFWCRRKSKRDRHKTTIIAERSFHVGKKNKSRSKSRSPGREIDRAIVIVHHTTCTHSRSRGNSPDNLSESSISFHENEVISDLSTSTVPRLEGGVSSVSSASSVPPAWYEGPLDPCVSVSRDTVRGGESRNLHYSNWESCRESWFSSGSDCPRPSSGSDCPPQPPRDKEPPRVPPHHPTTLPRAVARGGGGSSVGTIRQSSRESGSSSSIQSCRGGGGGTKYNPRSLPKSANR